MGFNNISVSQVIEFLIWGVKSFRKATKMTALLSYVPINMFFKNCEVLGLMRVWYHGDWGPPNWKCFTSCIFGGILSFVVWISVWSRSTNNTNLLLANNLRSSSLPRLSASSVETFSSGMAWIIAILRWLPISIFKNYFCSIVVTTYSILSSVSPVCPSFCLYICLSDRKLPVCLFPYLSITSLLWTFCSCT